MNPIGSIHTPPKHGFIHHHTSCTDGNRPITITQRTRPNNRPNTRTITHNTPSYTVTLHITNRNLKYRVQINTNTPITWRFIWNERTRSHCSETKCLILPKQTIRTIHRPPIQLIKLINTWRTNRNHSIAISNNPGVKHRPDPGTITPDTPTHTLTL